MVTSGRVLTTITEIEAKIINENLGSESICYKVMMDLSKLYNEGTKPYYLINKN